MSALAPVLVTIHRTIAIFKHNLWESLTNTLHSAFKDNQELEMKIFTKLNILDSPPRLTSMKKNLMLVMRTNLLSPKLKTEKTK